jgi:hypothetical protein
LAFEAPFLLLLVVDIVVSPVAVVKMLSSSAKFASSREAVDGASEIVVRTDWEDSLEVLEARGRRPFCPFWPAIGLFWEASLLVTSKK